MNNLLSKETYSANASGMWVHSENNPYFEDHNEAMNYAKSKCIKISVEKRLGPIIKRWETSTFPEKYKKEQISSFLNRISINLFLILFYKLNLNYIRESYMSVSYR